ncbi:hypothetical protein Ahy_B05g074510 [Arachis hypogaea]|uniref:Uncharacterized protein n=1 Tax=Arachis hypogaea TaxID=3818 RepID=A0A444YZE3_ARAHY|nr:hypothetical protein Ahy_B05g074510 [Arachis hypogaea]
MFTTRLALTEASLKKLGASLGDICSLNSNINLPWCLLGDFDATLHDYERRGGAGNNRNGACKDFQECVSQNGLLDLGYSDFFDVSGDWDEKKLQECLPKQVVDVILAISPPSP